MSVSAVDAITPALEHTKRQLFMPFRIGQWTKLAFVGLLAGELGSSGFNRSNFRLPRHPGGAPPHIGLPGSLGTDVALLIALIAAVVLATIITGALMNGFAVYHYVFAFLAAAVLVEMAHCLSSAEASALCQEHGYPLLAGMALSYQALVAAARGEHEKTLELTNQLASWGGPRRALLLTQRACHARALDAAGRGDFEAAYEHAATVTPPGTPLDAPHLCEGMTFSSRSRAYFWSFLSSTPLGWTSWRSRVIWSCGVVVVSPQPGQEKPGHFRQFDGLVCARRAL